MDGKDFLISAKKFVRSQFEADLRSAISRAYYALFHSAAQFLAELGFHIEQGPGVHGAVRNRLYNCGVEQLVDFAQTMDELRTQRNKADYDMNSKEFQNQAISALKVAAAELASEIVSQCNVEPLRSQIRNNIREYERKINP
jgi:uncharacterized protein (UPF0332 family)